MTDKMDVDITPSSSGGISASSSSSEKLDLSELDLNAFNDHMKTLCERRFWLNCIELADGDADGWQGLIADVLTNLMEALEGTNMKDRFINREDARAFVLRLDDDGLKRWKAGVRDGVEKNDWTALIVHRTYIWITRRLDHV